MRGKVHAGHPERLSGGITPAYAGKSPPARCRSWAAGDHPRVCGEKSDQAKDAAITEGSPPRMRGKDHGKPAGHGPLGITPACAGKSSQRSSATRSARDHPRVCGEKTFDRLLEMAEKGSPPRMRGKVTCMTLHKSWNGITPAYAGKSAGLRAAVYRKRDHPRVCGEKFRAYAKIWNEWGSPPRMRGKEWFLLA